MREEGLTIIIPTYNREERLKQQLNSLFKQEIIKSIKIVIIDNHSSYDIITSLKKNYSEETLENVEIIVRPFNVGLGIAITMPFLLCKTEWLWVLGDDDEVTGDINIILEDINRFKDCAYLKYNISNSSPQENKEIDNIEDFITYFGNKKHSTGDLVFISNSLFNLPLLEQYLGLALMWSGTLIGHLIPVLFGLCEGSIKCRMIDYNLVLYKTPMQGTGYDSIWVTLGISLIGDMEFPVTQKLNEKIYQLVQYDCSHLQLISKILTLENRRRSTYIYNRIYYSCYHLGSKNKLYRGLFYCCHISHINLAKYLLIILNASFNYAYSHMPNLKEYIKRKFPSNYRRIKFW